MDQPQSNPRAVDGSAPPVDQPKRRRASGQGRVPLWLAATVLVLLVGVLAAGAFLAREITYRRPPSGMKYAVPDALSKLRTLAENRPQDPKAHLDLAYAYQLAGEDQKALDEYSIVLKLSPSDTAALYNSGVELIKLHHGKTGAKRLRLVLKLQPTHVLAARELGQYYSSKHQWDKLVELMKRAVKANPEMADLQYLLGRGYEKTGHPHKALRQYKAALRYAPDLPSAVKAVARLEPQQ